METEIWCMPTTEVIDYKHSRLVRSFYFYSALLGTFCKIPEGFITDWESVPLIRGTSKVSGLIHDYFCRKDSYPVVSKPIAAGVYLEFLEYRNTPYWRRYAKYWVVCWAPGYFHKHYVGATYEDLKIKIK